MTADCRYKERVYIMRFVEFMGDIAMSTEKPRFSITVDDELFKRLEDYRFENRCPNRSQAVVELIRQRLDEYDKKKRKKVKKLLIKSY